ncbi:MAG: DUF922 domain-containing protein [Acidobacteria bacterium]|nr:DUF922 domain-containing protein [Acidobacteriota bacterium]
MVVSGKDGIYGACECETSRTATRPQARRARTTRATRKITNPGLEFAQARFQNPIHGRFTSVDPLTASATIRNPQSFNRYTYALNSPYKFTDPLGLLSEYTSGACGNRCPNSDGGMSGYAESYAAFLCNGFECTQEELPATAQQLNTYNVTGDTYEQAMANAKTEFRKRFGAEEAGRCEGGCIGLTSVKMADGNIGYQTSAKQANGVVTVTLTITVPTLTTKIWLPNWFGKGAAKASTADKESWARMVAKLKDHEDGHVQIAQEEIATTRAAIFAAFRKTTTFSFRPKKGSTKAEINSQIDAMVRKRLSGADKIVSDGFSRYIDRRDAYDRVTRHGQIWRNEVTY